MKILHIASGDLWGGAEAQLHTLACATRSLGSHVDVILMNRHSELARRLRSRGIDPIEFDESATSAPGLYRDLRGQVHALRPDVIHTHRFKENALGGLVARTSGIPSLRTEHGAPESELSTHTLRRRIIRAIDRFAAQRLQRAVVAVSPELASLLRSRVPAARIVVIPNGVDAAGLRARSLEPVETLPAIDDTFRIGFFGRLVPIKRIDLLIEAMVILRQRMARPVVLHLCGEGPLAEELKALSVRVGVADLVRFEGFQSNSPAWIARMNCVALTSDHEGLPMVVLEALALGVPVVARAIGGIPDVVGQVDPDWLVAQGSAEAIAARLAALASGVAPRSGDSLLPERYLAETNARSYLALYESLASAKPVAAATQPVSK